MDFKVTVALVSIAMTIFGYFFYFRDIFAHKTKPHAFSWLVWAVLTGIAFFGQLSGDAGPGAWVTATTAVISFVIFALALVKVLALENYTLVTWLYPASLVAANLFFAFMLVARRRKIEPVEPF